MSNETNQLMERMSWPEAREQYEAGKVVVMPIGSVEQHGPHLPVGTDYLIAQHIGQLLAEQCQDCLVTPTIPFGFADYHSDFAGTVSVNDQKTLERYLLELVSHHLRHGADHILFVNSHGGNKPILDAVSYRLRNEGVLAATVLWWDVLAGKLPAKSPAGHADWVETSMVLAIDEGMVRMDRANLPVSKNLSNPKLDLVLPHVVEFDGVRVHVSVRTRDFTDTGDMPEPGLTPQGDHTIPPTEASREAGEEIFAAVVSFLCDFIPEFGATHFGDVVPKSTTMRTSGV